MRSEVWCQAIEEISADRSSGAHKIASKCVDAFGCYAQTVSPSLSINSILTDLQSAAGQLLMGQPAMAPVLRICNDALLAVESAPSASDAVARMLSVMDELNARISRAEADVADQYLAHTLEVHSVVTLSYSSTVAAALRAAGNAGRELSVTVLESRPAQEGRRLARVAVEAGLSVSLVVDGAAYDEMEGADIWISGADALLPDGLVNKIGTGSLAAAAQVHGKPGFVLAETMKIWPATIIYPPISNFSADEVWPDSPPSVEIKNHYFECVPWSMIAGVLCEDGLMTQADVREAAMSLKLSNFIDHYFV